MCNKARPSFEYAGVQCDGIPALFGVAIDYHGVSLDLQNVKATTDDLDNAQITWPTQDNRHSILKEPNTSKKAEIKSLGDHPMHIHMYVSEYGLIC